MKYFQNFSRFLISYLTPERIFAFPALGKIQTLLMTIICYGGEKRFLTTLNKLGKIDRSTINGRMIHEALFNSRGKIRLKFLKEINVNSKNLTTFKSKLFSDDELERALNQLKHENFARIGSINHLPLFKNLLKLCDLPVYSSNTKLNILDQTNKPQLKEHPDPKVDFIWNAQSESLWDNESFRDILEDSFWSTISDKFFLGHSKITGFNMWHSFPHNKESSSPENWHRDANDGLFFIKFFVLLSDVTLENGPTAFIPVPIEDLPLKFLSGRRYSDTEIEKFCARRGIKPHYATGEAGTIYVGDTRGLHRGTPVLSGHRALINFRVSIDHQFGVNNSEKYNIPMAKFKSPEKFSIF
jgi:hypothetical protein